MENLKKAKCWLVPTDKAENSFLASSIKRKIFFEKGYCTQQYLKEIGKKSFHLHITSDEPIKVGDYYLANEALHEKDAPILVLRRCDTITNGWIESDSNKGQGDNPDWSYKIIISTDKYLNLPQPSQGFINAYIEAYNNGQQITEVNVEYRPSNYEDWYANGASPVEPYTIKTDSNNCATITKIKDSWNREEVSKAIHDCMILANSTNDIGRLQKFIDIWIEENL